jgi:cytoskeleton protein RodZ
MKKTGQILKETREAKSISLQEVSIHLKINTKTLKALETGDKSQLPAKTFLRGFVQSYAQFLKLDLNQIMEVFQEEMGTTHPGMIVTQIAQPPQNYGAHGSQNQAPVNSMSAHFQSVPKATSTETDSTGLSNTSSQSKSAHQSTKGYAGKTNTSSSSANSSTSASTPKAPISEPLPPSISFDPQTWSHSLKVGTAILVFLIISVIIGIKKTIDKYEREATLPKQEHQLVDTPQSSVPVNTNPEQDPALEVNASVLNPPVIDPINPINTEGTITSNLNVSRDALALSSKPIIKPEITPVMASPIVSPAAIAAIAATSTSTDSNVTSSTLTQTNTNQVASEIDSPQEVIIEALDKVVVEYAIDGGPKNSISLLAEKIHTFKAKKNISLSFSDGGSVNLIHNGKDKGVPGNLGQPYVVSFPK